MTWKPIATAPRALYRSVKVRLGANLAPYHVFWNGRGWDPVEFLNGGPNPTEWWDAQAAGDPHDEG